MLLIFFLKEVPDCGNNNYLPVCITEPQIEMSEDEKLEFVAGRILREHRAVFEELTK